MFFRLVDDLGAEHIEEVCRVFLENATLGIAAVRRALDAGDGSGAAEAAHGLKSSSGFLGASRLAGLCAAIEAGTPAAHPGDALAEELRRISDELHVLVGCVAGAPGTP